MSLKGIDIASYQENLNLNDISLDFAIIKATEGIGYVNPSCDKHFQQGLQLGKKLGVYHFARVENDAVAEANYFVDNIRGYIGNALLALDWEGASSNNVNWANTWLKTVYQLTGVKPIIYMTENTLVSFDWTPVVGGNYGLWVAKYLDYEIDYNYDMSNSGPAPKVKYWDFYAMWQWTSSGRLDGYSHNLDLNVFYGNRKAWDSYAKVR